MIGVDRERNCFTNLSNQSLIDDTTLCANHNEDVISSQFRAIPKATSLAIDGIEMGVGSLMEQQRN